MPVTILCCAHKRMIRGVMVAHPFPEFAENGDGGLPTALPSFSKLGENPFFKVFKVLSDESIFSKF